MLDDRKTAILRAIVEEYIATETPGVQTAVVARAVPDLATMSRPDRAVAMQAMLARIGQPRSAMMPAT